MRNSGHFIYGATRIPSLGINNVVYDDVIGVCKIQDIQMKLIWIERCAQSRAMY